MDTRLVATAFDSFFYSERDRLPDDKVSFWLPVTTNCNIKALSQDTLDWTRHLEIRGSDFWQRYPLPLEHFALCDDVVNISYFVQEDRFVFNFSKNISKNFKIYYPLSLKLRIPIHQYDGSLPPFQCVRRPKLPNSIEIK